MSTSKDELKNIAALAYIKTGEEDTLQLAKDVSAIMDFVEKLRQIDTTHIAPLLHPLDLHQRLRADVANVENNTADLAKIAPLFADNLYLVPKVIETGK